MDSLTLAIRRCNLELKVDNSTEGLGNCFPNAIIQQCRRPEIRSWLQKNRPGSIFNSQQNLRMKVTSFALRSREQAINDLRTKYENEIGPADNKSWEEYWKSMAQDGTWVDHIFIQMTAWYMTLDILILTTSSQPEDPFIFISGKVKNNQEAGSDPPLLLGNYTNIHYQSLLPVPLTTNAEEPRDELNPTKTIEENKSQANKRVEKKSQVNRDEERDLTAKSDDFIFKQGKLTLTFKSLDIQKWECPFCRQVITRIGQHTNNKNCPISQIGLDNKEFKSHLDSFKDGYRLQMSRKRKQKSRANLIEEKGPEVIRAEQTMPPI